MRLEDLESIIKEVMPFHIQILEPVHKSIGVPIQTSFGGFGLYPSASTRTRIMGNFYEGLTRGIYGGRLNDSDFDIEFVNGEVSGRTVRPDVIDDENSVHWESKGNYFEKECEIMERQLDGYKFLQYSNQDTAFLFSFYRHSLFEIRKKKRTEEEVIKGLLKGTMFSVVLPLGVILSLQKTPISKGVKLARNYQNKNTSWPPCLCINPHTFNRFLINPAENLELMGFDSERFEIERYLLPGIIKVNGKKLKPFPIVRIMERGYERWVEGFVSEYEKEMKTSENAGTMGLSMFEEEMERDSIRHEESYEPLSSQEQKGKEKDDDLPF